MSWEISNNISAYLSICDYASDNENIFSKFKKDPAYRQILEHISYDEGMKYVERFAVPISEVLENLSKFKENDFYGSPDIFDYGDLGNISPTTIRYIKNTYDILNYFKGIEIKNIVEIGGGYGGLCKVMSSVIDFDNYLLFDLPQPNKLSKKYISMFPDIEPKVQILTIDELEELEGVDLVVSNYAFSELSRDLQDEYYEKIISKSSNFYMMFNPISNTNLQFDEFLEITSEKFTVEYYCEYEDESIDTCNKVVYGKCLDI
jgi:putative sugar O-methyltransferase